MYTFSLILISILSHLLYVYSAVGNTSDSFLPLVLIQHKGKLYNPDQIKKGTTDGNLGLTGNTQFSKDNWTDQMFFCPADSTKQIHQINKANELMKSSYRLQSYYNATKINTNCLFVKKFKKNKALQCAKEPIPAIYEAEVGKLGEKQFELCGPYNRSILYKFVYDVCAPLHPLHRFGVYFIIFFLFDMAKLIRKVPFDYKQQTVYEICYNHQDHETIHTKLVITSFNLLFDERLKNEKRKPHAIISDTYQDFNKKKDFFEMEQLYKKLENPETLDRSSNNKESDIVEFPNIYLPQYLVSPDDLATAVLKKTAFHYINIRPMHKRLIDLWNYIGELIRNNFKDSKPSHPLEIYTGTFTSKDHSRKGWPYGVPHVWIKILYMKEAVTHFSSTLVILLKNEYNHRPYDFTLSGLCTVDYCESFKQKDNMVAEFSTLALEKLRCCILTDRIRDLLGKYISIV